jgi:hypothetical protein
LIVRTHQKPNVLLAASTRDGSTRTRLNVALDGTLLVGAHRQALAQYEVARELNTPLFQLACSNPLERRK